MITCSTRAGLVSSFLHHLRLARFNLLFNQPGPCKDNSPIEGFHRVTFVSNFDVNVEIGGHFGDQEHIMAIEAAV